MSTEIFYFFIQIYWYLILYILFFNPFVYFPLLESFTCGILFEIMITHFIFYILKERFGLQFKALSYSITSIIFLKVGCKLIKVIA